MATETIELDNYWALGIELIEIIESIEIIENIESINNLLIIYS